MSEDPLVRTLGDYLASVEEPGEGECLFRGVSKPEYELIPAIGRDWKEGYMAFRPCETERFREFKRRALPWLQFHPRNDWEWLMLAQHHGVPTRLLDWSTNALAALFFACRYDLTFDGTVYVLGGLEEINQEALKNPFDLKSDYRIRPPHISPRIAAQSAFFTVSNDPTKPFSACSIRKIRIRSSDKQSLLSQISRYGINHATLFPGLDGLAQEIKFEMMHQKANHSMP